MLLHVRYTPSTSFAVVLTDCREVARQPSDPQASLGLTRCIEACKQIEVGTGINHGKPWDRILMFNWYRQRLWPFTARLRTLLEGARAHLDEYKYYPQPGSGRKRNADDAMGSYKNPDVSVRDLYAIPPLDSYSSASSSSNSNWDSAHHARMVAHSLGVHTPETEASATHYPGYQWWPSQLMSAEGLPHMPAAPTDASAPTSYSALPDYSQQPRHTPHPPPSHTSQTSTGMQQSFTFGQGPQEFVPGVTYTPFHFDRHYTSQPSGPRHDSAPRQ